MASSDIKLSRFTLSFTCSVCEEGFAEDPLSAEMLDAAMDHYKQKNTWYEYIQALMTDTMEDSNLEEELYDDASLEPKRIRIELVKSEKDSSEFTGTISWIGARCLPEDNMYKNAEWRIDDRMSQYGCEDMDFFVSVQTTGVAKQSVKLIKKEE